MEHLLSFETLSKITVAFLGAIFGAFFGRSFIRNRERIILAFDMHKEFNNLEMARHRKIAAKLIAIYPDKDFRELEKIDEEKTTSVLMIMRFYQRLWISIRHKQIKESLVKELFAEVFYYWFSINYIHGSIPKGWDANGQIKKLGDWFSKNDKARYNKEVEEGEQEYQRRIALLTKQ